MPSFDLFSSDITFFISRYFGGRQQARCCAAAAARCWRFSLPLLPALRGWRLSPPPPLPPPPLASRCRLPSQAAAPAVAAARCRVH